MKLMQTWRWMPTAVLLAAIGTTGRAQEFAVQSFDATGRLTYGTLNDGTNYSYRVEWAPSPAGPWSEFGASGANWLNAKPQAAGATVTNRVPMCYRVVATPGDYMAVDLSGGPGASSYPVAYYRTLADLPGGPNSYTYKTTRMLLRLIPKGTFIRGSPSEELGRNSDEAQHTVTLTQDFYLGVFEVTQKQWERVTGEWPSYFNNETCRDSRPVDLVSYDAIRGSSAGAGWPASSAVDDTAFLGKLRARTGLAFDLPTEAQWEYACRAGTATALNSGYNLADTGDDARVATVGRFWYNGGSGNTPDGDTSVGSATVGSYRPNAWGLYDMHGNVWEWCLDVYGTYPDGATDPQGASSGSVRVDRGGSWNYGAGYCRAAFRDPDPPDGAFRSVGCRIALSPGGQ